MKMKKTAAILALALAVSALSGCATEQKTQFGDYWNVQPLVFEPIDETCVYDVTHNAENAATYGYKLSYSNGSYTTTLKSGVENGQNIYVYTSTLTIDVTYELGEEEPKTFTDTVVSEARFQTAKNGLTPISSKKEVVSHSPVAKNPLTLNNCYQLFEYEYSIAYEGAGGKVTLTQNGKTTERSFDIKNDKLSYLDNEQLLLSLRALPTNATSAKVQAYSPFTASVQKVDVTFAQQAEGEFNFSKNGVTPEEKQKIAYRPVQLLLDEKDSGLGQVAWIATSGNTTSNEHRNVILRLESPVYRGMGTLVYTLSSVLYQ